MITIQLQLCHDRRTGETTLSRVDNGHQTPVTGSSSLAPILTEPLSQWLAPNDQWPGFFAMIRKYYGTSCFAITFTGEEEDYRLLEQARDQYALHMSVELCFQEPAPEPEKPLLSREERKEIEEKLAILQQILLTLNQLRPYAVQMCGFSLDRKELPSRQKALRHQLRIQGRFDPPYYIRCTDQHGTTRIYIREKQMPSYVEQQQKTLEKAYRNICTDFEKTYLYDALYPFRLLQNAYHSCLHRLNDPELSQQWNLHFDMPPFQRQAAKEPWLPPADHVEQIYSYDRGFVLEPCGLVSLLYECLLESFQVAFDNSVEKTLVVLEKRLDDVKAQAARVIQEIDVWIKEGTDLIQQARKLLDSLPDL